MRQFRIRTTLYIIKSGCGICLRIEPFPQPPFICCIRYSVSFVILQCTARTYRSMTLQNITATTVLIKVAARAGPTMAVGFTLPYWLRYAIMFMGISCSEDMLIMRNVHISLLAVPACLAAALCPAVSSCPGVSFRPAVSSCPGVSFRPAAPPFLLLHLFQLLHGL